MPEQTEWPVGISTLNYHEFISRASEHVARRGKDMAGYFKDEPEPDTLIYEVFEMETAGHMNLALTVLRPGMVGREYHMTKGHYHEDNMAGEVYVCLSGQGYIIMQTRDGRTGELALAGGMTAYIPPGWAHRTVNTGHDELVLLAIYPKTAGHDYESILKHGFSRRVVEGEDGPVIV